MGKAANANVERYSGSRIRTQPSTDFGFRWAHRVNSMVLGDLPGHVSVVTPENYYVGTNPNRSLNSSTR
jgi:hypothetical protein